MPPGNGTVTVSRSPASRFVSVMVAETSSVLSRSLMVVSVSAIGIGAPFSVNVVRNVVRSEPPELSGSRSITGGAVVHRLHLDNRQCGVAVAGAVVDDNLNHPRDV